MSDENIAQTSLAIAAIAVAGCLGLGYIAWDQHQTIAEMSVEIDERFQTHSIRLTEHERSNTRLVEALGGAVGELQRDLDSLETAAFGQFGPSWDDRDAIGDLARDVGALRSCVDDLLDSIAFSGNFFRC